MILPLGNKINCKSMKLKVQRTEPNLNFSIMAFAKHETVHFQFYREELICRC